MSVIRITKQFNFEMAHALHNYDGLCKNIHGHSYKLFVTVIGTPLKDDNALKNGMVIDFTELKKVVSETIVNIFDHSLMLSKNSFNNNIEILKKQFPKIIIVDYQPTSENMLIDFSEKIRKVLPQNNKLFSLKLSETATSDAEWYSDDN